MNKHVKRLIVLAVLILAVLALVRIHPESPGTGAGVSGPAVKAKPTSLDDLRGLTFGVQTGSTGGTDVETLFPEKPPVYFNSLTDQLIALRTHKVDAIVTDDGTVRFMMYENKDLYMVPERLSNLPEAPAFPKTPAGQALCDQYNAFIKPLWEDGTIDEITDIWFGPDESRRVVLDYENLPATNGTLKMATEAAYPPYVYVKDGRIVGYDVDIMARFCQAGGYRLEIINMDFSGLLAAVQSGKCDFAASSITVTEERAESVLFGEPYYLSGNVALLLSETAGGAGAEGDQAASSGGGVGESFSKTFLREDRWRLFLQGVVCTLTITLASVLFGTLLGFLVFMLCRNGGKVANGITRAVSWLVQGMPVVVLLMVLYYIVFALDLVIDVGLFGRKFFSVSFRGFSGEGVSIVAFTLTFGASVVSLLRMGVGTVDRGQYEAAYALGYTDRQTFFRFILPQALPHVMSAFGGEIVSLIKATAVVGYIAVQDLTKMGDIVRSRTYEAFFPLIAVTVIYFVLEVLFGFVVRKISLRLDPKRRKPARILKGVKTDD